MTSELSPNSPLHRLETRWCETGNAVQLPGIDFPKPVISFAVKPLREGDDEKLISTLNRMGEEDPTFRLERNDITSQLLVSGLGELHISLTRERMKDRFGVETDIEPPKVPYRETIRRRVSGIQGRYKRQSGGRGQFGDCWINISPLERGTGFEFVDSVVGGSIPRNYIPAVEKGIRGKMEQGVIAGYPLVDTQIELYDGRVSSCRFVRLCIPDGGFASLLGSSGSSASRVARTDNGCHNLSP